MLVATFTFVPHPHALILTYLQPPRYKGRGRSKSKEGRGAKSPKRSKSPASGQKQRATQRSNRSRSKTPKKEVAKRSASKGGKKRKLRALLSAPPSLPLILTYLAILLATLYSLKEYVDLGTFPSPKSSPFLTVMRGTFAAVCVAAELYEMSDGGKVEKTHYSAGSKLIPATVNTSGLRQLTFFTHWSWLMLAMYFALTIISPTSTGLLAVSWSIAAPNAFLTTVIITFVIWPTLTKDGVDTSNLSHLPTLAMHCLNTIMVALEMYLASTPLILSLIPLAPLYGLAYVLFAWAYSPLACPESGPQFYYFFLDTTLPKKQTCLSLIGLLAVLLVFYCIGCLVSVGLDYAEGAGYGGRAGFVLTLMVLSVCKVRD